MLARCYRAALPTHPGAFPESPANARKWLESVSPLRHLFEVVEQEPLLVDELRAALFEAGAEQGCGQRRRVLDLRRLVGEVPLLLDLRQARVAAMDELIAPFGLLRPVALDVKRVRDTQSRRWVLDIGDVGPALRSRQGFLRPSHAYQ
jgi:hypothetical protein